MHLQKSLTFWGLFTRGSLYLFIIKLFVQLVGLGSYT